MTEEQKKMLETIGKRRENINMAPQQLGINRKAVENKLTRIFASFEEMVNYMLEFYPVFEGRFNEHPELYSKTRKLARRIRGEVKP